MGLRMKDSLQPYPLLCLHHRQQHRCTANSEMGKSGGKLRVGLKRPHLPRPEKKRDQSLE
eukprot:525121-Amphidinium_carterae.1